MKKALILSPFFYPEPISTGKYNTYLAKALVNAGYCVEIYCSHPLYPEWKVELSNAELEGCIIHRSGAWMRYPKNVLVRRAVLELWYAGFFLRQLFLHKSSFDLIIPIYPPSLFALLLPFATKKNTKVVGIVHDLQGVYAGQKKGRLGRVLQAIITYVERRAFNQCNHIIYLSESMRKVANTAYAIVSNKTSVYYPFNTIEQFIDNGNLALILPSNQINIVYSGALGEKQAPYQILDFFMEVLKQKSDVHCYIFSQGQIFEQLKKQYQHQHLYFYPLVAEQDLPELLLRSSVQLLPQASGTSDGSLPSKLPNILASLTKVLCVSDENSELYNIVNNYSNGKVVSSWDTTVLVDNLQHLLAAEIQPSTINNDELLLKFTKEGLVKHLSTI